MKKLILLNLLITVSLLLCSFTSPKNQVSVLEQTQYKTVKKLSNIELNDSNIKSTLTSLGINNDMIKNLTEENLYDYKRAYNIYTVEVDYSKYYIGNTIVLQKNDDCFGGGTVPQKEHIADPLENDKYMKLFYVFTELPGREFKFSVDAEWFKMPYFRFTDSLGCTCMYSTVINSSRMGYYTCDYEMEYNGAKNFMKIRNDFTADDFKEATSGVFYGSACVFKLPIDMDVSSSTNGRVYHYYKNLKVHYEYKGHYNGSNDNPFINTSATYCHQRIGIDVTPSIEVSFKGYPQIGFGMSFLSNYEYRTVGFKSDIKLELL